MLLEVGGHGGVAAQSLTRALQTTVTLHDPGAAVRLLPQHAAALLGGGTATLWRCQWITGRVVLEDTDDVVEEIIEELRNTLISYMDRKRVGLKSL